MFRLIEFPSDRATLRGSASLTAPHDRVPAQMIFGSDDEVPRASPALTRAACIALPEPEECKLDVGGGYSGHQRHPSPWFNRVAAKQAAFLTQRLAAAVPS
jgi:hypothetical protein